MRAIAVFALVIAMMLALGCQPGKKAPERTTLLHDFGEARQGSSVQHTFTVTNSTQNPLRVRQVQTTCGCTATSVEKGTTIEPGKSIEVPVTVNLQGKHDAVESKVLLHFSDGVQPTEMVMRGRVAKEYPDSVQLAKCKRGEQPAETIELKTYPGQPPLEITDIEYKKDLLEVTVVPGSSPGVYSITIKPIATAPYGTFHDQVVVHTNDTTVPDKRINVHGHILKKLEATRARVTLEPDKESGAWVAVAEFTSTYGEPIENVAVEISRPKRFRAERVEDAPEGVVRVRVSAADDVEQRIKKQYARAALTVTATVGGEEVREKVDVLYMPEGLPKGLELDPNLEPERDNTGGGTGKQ